MSWHTDLVGPFAVDDVWFVEVLQPDGAAVISGMQVMGSPQNNREVPLGIYNHPAIDAVPIFWSPHGIADGTSLTVRCRILHSNFFSVVDSVDITGWSWDPVSHLWNYLAHILVGGSTATDVAAIKAAVYRTFPAAT